MTVWICGNSHTGALRRGLDRIGDLDGAVRVFALGNGRLELQPFSEVDADRVRLTADDYRTALMRATGADAIGTEHVWGICMGTHNARLYRAEFWRGAAPSALAGTERRPVSEALLDAMVERDQRHIRDFLAGLCSIGARCFVVSAPPPRADHRAIRRGIPVPVVTAIDAHARRRFREWLTERHIDFVDHPPEAARADGLLKPRFNAAPFKSGRPDPHHANPDYGELMMRRVLAYLRRQALLPPAIDPPAARPVEDAARRA